MTERRRHLETLRSLRRRLVAEKADEDRRKELAALDWVLREMDPTMDLLEDEIPSPPATYLLYTDGGSRCNPGPAAYGVVLYDSTGGELARRAARIGRATNNVAEYQGLLAGLQLARALGARRLEVRLDAELLVKQLNGVYKTKNKKLAELKHRVEKAARAFTRVSYRHVPREQNRLADALANAALDGRDPETV
ncbi:MAG: reverse transcriptase-like protein [Candidatus Coatesbacteria bacterium]|nr:reverse transcriptase-like protein [Candidatus Coatesbacteria bacterium]